jgi:hypothetical protein
VKYISLIDLARKFNLSKIDSAEQLFLIPEIKDHPNFENIKQFITIQNKETIVFNGWIEQNKPLKELLISSTTTDFFTDSQNWKQHAFFDKFKHYVSPFFKELIQRKNHAEISSEWAKIFSYFVLLEDDSCFYIEQLFYTNIQKSITEKLVESQKNISESDFHQILLFLLSDDSIKIHNSLSRASHALKVNFIERILQLFYHPKCSAKLAHWMILSLTKMELNLEQNESLKQIKDKIKNGQIFFSNTNDIKNQPIKKNLIFILSSLFGIGLFIYLFNQQTSAEFNNFKEASSLVFFSVKERKEIDSVLKSMEIEQDDSLNTTYFTGNTITVKGPIINVLAQKIYKEFELDMSNHFLSAYDTCLVCNANNLKNEKIDKTFSLSEINSNHELEIKNDSEYSFLILAWNETKQGEVYSGFLNQKSTFKIKILEGMNMIFISGSSYGEIPNKHKSDFSLLKNHFCSIDFNYEFSLQKIQSVGSLNYKESKILLEGTLGEVIILTDSNGILE